jgi:hypothetical protein
MDSKLPRLEADLATLKGYLAVADSRILEIERLHNAGLMDDATYARNIATFTAYKARVQAAIDAIVAQINALKAAFEDRKNSFISLCSPSFVSQCTDTYKCTGFTLTPKIQTNIDNKGPVFCAALFNETLSWQCPYKKELEICKATYDAEIARCENETSALRKLACQTRAYGNKLRCDKNPPGYPGLPGTPNGIPIENDKYNNIPSFAAPYCGAAIAGF